MTIVHPEPRPWSRAAVRRRFIALTVEAEPIDEMRFRLTVRRHGAAPVFVVAPSLRHIPEYAVLAARETSNPPPNGARDRRVYYVRKLNIVFPEPKD
ncbi:hypothetical protein SEA_MACGULLY_82 [Rhodococcus phage MacGully]|nr:hypothetical protein SEA_MACGULLY_82 [Rhodococcus phage MacGully]